MRRGGAAAEASLSLSVASGFNPRVSDDLAHLLESATGGDEVALGKLLERYLPDLHAFVRLRAGRMVLAREESADLVQSVCREALGELDGFRYEGEAAFRAWLYTVARRKLADRYAFHHALKRDVGREVPLEPIGRGSQSRASSDLADRYQSLVSPSRQMEAKELLSIVEGAFAELSEDHREVILLSRFLRLPHKDVAERMGRSEGSTRMLLARALAALARHLDHLRGDGGATR